MTAATRIVVADDDADIRELVTLKLAAAGYAVTSVCDGPAALEAIRRELPHLAVLDVLMPGMTGVEVCRALRRWGPTERLPIILLTARVQESDIEDGYSAGADDYVSKPFSPRELAVRVGTVLQRAAP